MGEIAPRRIAVFIGYAYRKTYIFWGAQVSPLGKVGLRHKIKLGKQSHAEHLINFEHSTQKSQ